MKSEVKKLKFRKEKKMENLVVGSDVVVDGRWMQVDEIFDAKTGEKCKADADNVEMFAIDQDGESHNISPDMIDHIY